MEATQLKALSSSVQAHRFFSLATFIFIHPSHPRVQIETSGVRSFFDTQALDG